MGSSPIYTVHFTSSDHKVVPYTSSSQILRPDPYFDSLTRPHVVASSPRETYGNPSAPKCIRIGNGGLGPTGILRALCEAYLMEKGLSRDLRFEWVCNHSRHTQIAMCAGVVDLALTYERGEEAIAVKEGWCRDEGELCHDRFILAGPSDDPAGLGSGLGPEDLVNAFKKIAESHSRFHTRGDGSATMHREIAIWEQAGYTQKERDESDWFERVEGSPMDAVRWANQHRTYLLVDRSTLLHARDIGDGLDIRSFIEGGEMLDNTCVIGIRADEKREMVLDFVQWLKGKSAVNLIKAYGKNWELGIAIVSVGEELDFPLDQTIQAKLPIKPSLSLASTSPVTLVPAKAIRPTTLAEMPSSSSVLPKELVM